MGTLLCLILYIFFSDDPLSGRGDATVLIVIVVVIVLVLLLVLVIIAIILYLFMSHRKGPRNKVSRISTLVVII